MALATPTGEVQEVAGVQVNMLAAPGVTKQLVGAIEAARGAAGTTSMIPGNRQRYILILNPDSGEFGISVLG